MDTTAINLEDGHFDHECEHPGCRERVFFDDEPWCFTHSPDSGSAVYGYSARRKAEAAKAEHNHRPCHRCHGTGWLPAPIAGGS